VSGFARSLAETGSSIEKRFLAGRCARLEQEIAMLSEGQMNVCPIDFGRVGFGELLGRNRK